MPPPVIGAAKYFASGCDVYMLADGYESCIQNCRTIEFAKSAAIKWQIKENKTVSKHRIKKL